MWGFMGKRGLGWVCVVWVEVGCGGKLLDESWSPNEFCEGDVWGHDGLVEAVVEASETARARMQAAAS